MSLEASNKATTMTHSCLRGAPLCASSSRLNLDSSLKISRSKKYMLHCGTLLRRRTMSAAVHGIWPSKQRSMLCACRRTLRRKFHSRRMTELFVVSEISSQPRRSPEQAPCLCPSPLAQAGPAAPLNFRLITTPPQATGRSVLAGKPACLRSRARPIRACLDNTIQYTPTRSFSRMSMIWSLSSMLLARLMSPPGPGAVASVSASVHEKRASCIRENRPNVPGWSPAPW